MRKQDLITVSAPTSLSHITVPHHCPTSLSHFCTCVTGAAAVNLGRECALSHALRRSNALHPYPAFITHQLHTKKHLSYPCVCSFSGLHLCTCACGNMAFPPSTSIAGSAAENLARERAMMLEAQQERLRAAAAAVAETQMMKERGRSTRVEGTDGDRARCVRLRVALCESV